MKKSYFLLIGVLFFINKPTFAQNSISVSNSEPKFISTGMDLYGDMAKTVSTQYAQWLNYVTLTDPGDPAFSITVGLRPEKEPGKVNLQVDAGPYQGMSQAKEGTAQGKMEISHGSRVLVDDITTCYTGAGRGQGHRIAFSFSIPVSTKDKAEAQNLSVVYTLTQ